jgi:hypothetical protein
MLFIRRALLLVKTKQFNHLTRTHALVIHKLPESKKLHYGVNWLRFAVASLNI